MKQILTRAVFFLGLIVLSLILNFSVYAAGAEEEPTPTPSPTPEVIIEVAPYGGAPYGAPVYGGGVITPKEGEVLVDKMVKNPSSGKFVDHLGPTDPKYRPLNIITFQIKVNNPSDETLAEVEVSDTLPEFVDFMTGPGNFDSDSRKLTFTVTGLASGESRNFEVKARISHQSILPEDKTVICPLNVVDAIFSNRKDHDESQFCIEKEMEVPQVPQAGAEHWILALLGSALSAGIYLRKKALKFK